MFRPTLIPFAAALLLSACADETLVGPAALAPASAANDVVSVWASTETGETGPGSKYALYMPTSWNGEVVFYAHGIKLDTAAVELPTGDGFPAVRDALGQRGYAVAYSSFSENGWALKDGAQRTHQLSGLFTSKFRKPARSYLMGTSLGGLVVQDLAEKFPPKYDGVFAMCTPLAGTKAELEYIANVRVLFDYFYPGVLPGDVLHVPAGLNVYRDVIIPVVTAVTRDPRGLGAMARIAQTPLAGNSGPELVTSLVKALGYDIYGIDDFLGRTHGHSMFDNSRTVYTAAAPGLLPPSLLAHLNSEQGVGRFTSTPDAERYLVKYFQPAGTLTVPTLTLHTLRDPLVPFGIHEPPFAALVSNAGRSSLLLQRSVNEFGHCAFSTAQMVDGFETLARWVESGVKPAS